MKYKELTTAEDVKEVLYNFERACDYAFIDTETTGLHRYNDRILAITLTSGPNDTAYFIDGQYAPLFQELRDCTLVLHNFKFDFHMFANSGVDLRKCGPVLDTLLLDHLLDENLPHGLDDIIQRRYGDDYKAKFWEKYNDYGKAAREDQIEYACKDVLYTARIFYDTTGDLTSAGVPQSLIKHVHRLAQVLYDTETAGIRIDLPYVAEKGEHLSKLIVDLKLKMRTEVEIECQLVENELYEKELDKRKTPKGKLGVKRPSFNFDSPVQLGSLLYNHLGLPVQVNKQRKRTVDDNALANLESKHPVIPVLREYRGHQKVFTSFIEGTLEKVEGSRIYPSFNVNGTVTGRISSSEPNLQQLPSSGGVRGIYVPDSEKVFISADYKQLEVVIAAHYSRDSNLLKIVHEGASQHDITAAGLGIDRSIAKKINFALQYGAGPPKVKSILGCSDKDAELAFNRYWETYSGLREFVRGCHLKVERGEPLVNPFGRHRRFSKTFADHWEKERAKRQAPNALIQGTGSDCTSYSLYTIDAVLRNQGLGKALFSVHDEIIVQVDKTGVDRAKEIIQTVMVGIGKEIELTVPLSVEVSNAMNRWED